MISLCILYPKILLNGAITSFILGQQYNWGINLLPQLLYQSKHNISYLYIFTMNHKLSLAFVAILLLLISCTIAQRVNKKVKKEKKIVWTPVTNLTDPRFFYALAYTMRFNDQISNQSQFDSASYSTSKWDNNTLIYKITFTNTDGQKTYEFSSQPAPYDQVITAFLALQAVYPASSNVYYPIFRTQGEQGNNLTVIISSVGAERFTQMEAYIAVNGTTTNITSFNITCHSKWEEKCLDDRQAYQVFLANNQFYVKNPNVTAMTHILQPLQITQSDATALTFTAVQKFTPKNQGPVITATIKVTPTSYELTYE